jgi:Uma2 family endonuclease
MSDQPTSGAPDFRYGRRQIFTQNETAQPTYAYEPLAPADFLNPQEGDEFNHGERHDADVRRLRAILRRHYRNNPFMGVFGGIPIVWNDPALPHPAPDVVIVPNAADPHRPRVHFDVAAEEARPRCIVEVISPYLADQDLVDKRSIYAQAGVEEYIVVDSGLRSQDGPVEYRILGYRLERDVYTPLAADEQGRLHSNALRVWFAVTPDKQSFNVFDARAGAAIEPDSEDEEKPAAAQIEGAFRAQSIASQLDFLRP